jgi:hypothetical protein
MPSGEAERTTRVSRPSRLIKRRRGEPSPRRPRRSRRRNRERTAWDNGDRFMTMGTWPDRGSNGIGRRNRGGGMSYSASHPPSSNLPRDQNLARNLSVWLDFAGSFPWPTGRFDPNFRDFPIPIPLGLTFPVIRCGQSSVAFAYLTTRSPEPRHCAWSSVAVNRR